MANLPNCGVNFILGYYKIEVSVLNPGSNNRNFILENENGVTGLCHKDLIAQIKDDVDTLEKSILKFVEKSRESFEREG